MLHRVTVMFTTRFTTRAGYSFGQSAQAYNTISEGSLGNPNVVWERAQKLDIGLDMNLFQDKISVTADYFHDTRYRSIDRTGQRSKYWV
jgi:hypothetical protein